MKQKTMKDYLKKLKINILYCPKCHMFGEGPDWFNTSKYYCTCSKSNPRMRVLLVRKPTRDEKQEFLKTWNVKRINKLKERIDKNYKEIEKRKKTRTHK